MALHIVTPLIESVPLSAACGREVWLKLENTQPSASFKLRGIGKLCSQLYEEGKRTFICPSSGNAGYSTVWACRELGAKALIVAPSGTPADAVKAIESLGAEVIVRQGTWDVSNAYALELTEKDPEAVYVTPYDDPVLWDGHATMIDEITEQAPWKPDLVICAVGGGGLISGVTDGLIRNGWTDVPILGCGTNGADAFCQTIRAHDTVNIGTVSSLVHCISATHVTPHIVDCMDTVHYKTYVTDDVTAVDACEKFMVDHRFIVDPACGVALSSVYTNAPELGDAKRIIVIVCGGAGVVVDEYKYIRDHYASEA